MLTIPHVPKDPRDSQKERYCFLFDRLAMPMIMCAHFLFLSLLLFLSRSLSFIRSIGVSFVCTFQSPLHASVCLCASDHSHPTK